MCAVDGETDGPTGRLIEWKTEYRREEVSYVCSLARFLASYTGIT